LTVSAEEFQGQLAAADARGRRATAELAAAADDRARVIAAEVKRRGRGGARQVAAELGVSEKTIFQAVARGRRTVGPSRRLPADTLVRLLAGELDSVPPLRSAQWRALAWLIRGTLIDETWIGQPGELLALEVEDAELVEALEPDVIIAACRAWSPVRAMAVIDACQRDDLSVLPVED